MTIRRSIANRRRLLHSPTWQGWPGPPAIHFVSLTTKRREEKPILKQIPWIFTTITPYLFFWQADGEVEDKRGVQGISHRNADIIAGMVRSNLTAFFIIVATGVVLHSHHSAIKTAADAAHALEPAGHGAAVMFLADVAVFYHVATESLPS